MKEFNGVCVDCLKSEQLPVNWTGGTLVIGVTNPAILSSSRTVVFIKGDIKKELTANSDGAGLFSVDVSSLSNFFSSAYECVYMMLLSGASQPISFTTNGGVTANCACLRFNRNFAAESGSRDLSLYTDIEC